MDEAMKPDQAFALILFTCLPGAVVFGILLLFDVHILMACLISGVVIGFGIDVCLFGKEETHQDD